MAKKKASPKKKTRTKAAKRKPQNVTPSERPFCFVLMPFTSARSTGRKYNPLGETELDTIYALVKKLLARAGYQVRRAAGKGDILREIVFDIDRAELVVADLTGLNPNVMYELGIRHAFTKKTILLTQDLAELPFDLKNYHCIKYGWIVKSEQEKLGKDLRDCLKGISTNPDVRFGPVHSHLGTKRLGILDEEKQATIRKLKALIAEIQYLTAGVVRVAHALAAQYPKSVKETKSGWTVDQKKINLAEQEPTWIAVRSTWPATFPSMDLFLSSRYVDDRFNKHGDIYAFTGLLGSFRMQLHTAGDSIRDFLVQKSAIQMLSGDLPIILSAVEGDRFGEDLQLESRKLG